MGKTTKIIHAIRKSTAGQSTAAQKNYHAGRRTKLYVGSAWKKGKNPVIKDIYNLFKKGENKLIFDLFSADRFSRNTFDCYKLKEWLRKYKKDLIVIANRQRYNFVKDFDKFIQLVRDPEAQSRAISEKSKKMWREYKLNPQHNRQIILTNVEKYFVRQIIFTTDDNDILINVNELYEKLRSCGIAKFSKSNIRKWRQELEPVRDEELFHMECKESKLCFAHPEGEHDIDNDPAIWTKYQRFIPHVEFATNLAQNYPNLNGVWEPERGLDNMQAVDQAIDDIIEDAVIINEEEVMEEEPVISEAAPAADILQKIKEAHDMLQAGIINEQEFSSIKSKFI